MLSMERFLHDFEKHESFWSHPMGPQSPQKAALYAAAVQLHALFERLQDKLRTFESLIRERTERLANRAASGQHPYVNYFENFRTGITKQHEKFQTRLESITMRFVKLAPNVDRCLR
jgi:hypothetical protein